MQVEGVLYDMIWTFIVFFFNQKTAYESLIMDWSSDVCSSDLTFRFQLLAIALSNGMPRAWRKLWKPITPRPTERSRDALYLARAIRSEEHTSELQSLMRISYAVFCLKKKNTIHTYAKQSKSQKHYI